MLPTERQDRDMYRYTGKILAGMGYERYEISNYARSGYECRHNLGYWTGVPYLGLGLGAASYYEGKRFRNTYDMKGYIQCLSEPDYSEVKCPEPDCSETNYPELSFTATGGISGEAIPCETGRQTVKNRIEMLREEVIPVSKKEQMEEFMFLGLRLRQGVSKEVFFNQFGHTMDEVYGSVIKKYVEQGFLGQEGQRVYLTSNGIDVSNYVLADFLLEDEFEGH